MEKPIVFLSHSSLDKAPLVELKKLLDTRAAGSLNFFLSSDGESIRFGRNWVVRISDALAQAKLMFVFLSPQSAESKWVHFEAGCAYANDIQVVPVCLPGIDLNRISPPLSLLQGFNLHSHDAVANIARICNKVFDMKIIESFSREDFENVIAHTQMSGGGFFGDLLGAIDAIKLYRSGDVPSRDFNPIPILHALCHSTGTNCHSSTSGDLPDTLKARFEQPGCTVEFENFQIGKPVDSEDAGAYRRAYRIECVLSPELFHLNAPLLDQWLEQTCLESSIYVDILFRKQIEVEKQRERFTSKLFSSGIRLTRNGPQEFEGFEFSVRGYDRLSLHFLLVDKLEDKRLPRTLERLFKSGVLWKREPDFTETQNAVRVY